MSRRRYGLGLMLALAVLPLAHGAEAEIYVTTGPDGIEMFSNLPRGPVMPAGLPGSGIKDRAVVVSSIQRVNLSRHETDVAAKMASPSAEMPASGKSFLLDD